MTPVSISRPDLLRRVGAIVRWRPVAFLLGVAVAAVAFSLYLDVAARAKVPADLQAAARSQGTVTVSVNLGFPPEEFHLQELQAYGIVTSVEGNTVNLSDVSATELHALARRYWVGTIEAMGLFALGTGFRPPRRAGARYLTTYPIPTERTT